MVNVGKTDAIIRAIIGILLPHFTKWGILSGTAWIIIFHIIGTVLIITAVTRYCPLYKLINKSTA